MTHPGHPQSLAVGDWFLIAAICSPIGVLIAIGLARLRRARAAVRDALGRADLDVIRLKRCLLRVGPFPWTTSGGRVVYRVTARDARGRQRTGWARWGRAWLFSPDTLDFRWDD